MHVDTRVEQLRHDFSQAMVDSALTLQGVMQEVHGQGQGMAFHEISRQFMIFLD